VLVIGSAKRKQKIQKFLMGLKNYAGAILKTKFQLLKIIYAQFLFAVLCNFMHTGIFCDCWHV
jgi:hypothetical protein